MRSSPGCVERLIATSLAAARAAPAARAAAAAASAREAPSARSVASAASRATSAAASVSASGASAAVASAPPRSCSRRSGAASAAWWACVSRAASASSRSRRSTAWARAPAESLQPSERAAALATSAAAKAAETPATQPEAGTASSEEISSASSRASATGSEEELLPRRPPVVGARDDRAVVDQLDAVAVAELRDGVGPLVLDLDLARLARVVGLDGVQVAERLLGAGLDCFTRARGHEVARAEDACAALDLHRGEAVAEQVAALLARGLIAGHEHDRRAPGAAERGVDAGLADERVVEPEVLEVTARDGVVEHAFGRPGPRVHADEERGVDALLEELGVLRPLVLHHELAVGVEILGDQRVERVAAAGTVAVHRDDLGRAGGLGAAHGRVDLLGVELAALLEERRVTVRRRARLLALDDPGDALDVADDEDLHACSLARRGLRARREARARHRRVRRHRRRLRAALHGGGLRGGRALPPRARAGRGARRGRGRRCRPTCGGGGGAALRPGRAA